MSLAARPLEIGETGPRAATFQHLDEVAVANHDQLVVEIDRGAHVVGHDLNLPAEREIVARPEGDVGMFLVEIDDPRRRSRSLEDEAVTLVRGPRSKLSAFEPASRIARSFLGRLTTVVRTVNATSSRVAAPPRPVSWHVRPTAPRSSWSRAISTHSCVFT